MSGEWFGEIPQHWESEKIGALFAERRMKVSDKDYPPLSVAKIGVVHQLETAVKTDAGDNRKLVCKGDFVINSRSDRKGSCGVSKLDGSVSLINIVLTPRGQLSGGYTHYLLRSQPFAEEYYRNGRGIVSDLWTTRYSEMKSIMLPIPPRDEQEQIVRFLDWKVSAINRLIAMKRHKNQLLDDIKQKLIDDTISAIPKIATQRLKAAVRCNLRTLDESTSPSYTFRYVDIGSVNAKQGITKYESMTFSQAPSRARRIVKCNDIIVSTVRTYLRAITKIEDDDNVIVSTGFAVFTPYNANSMYLEYCFKSNVFCNEVVRRSIGIAYPSIKTAELLDIRIPLPSLELQLKIAKILEANSKKIDTAIENGKKCIEKLQDLKARLISDVVTGKIDVRGVEVPEFAPVEEEAGTDMNEEEVSE